MLCGLTQVSHETGRRVAVTLESNCTHLQAQVCDWCIHKLHLAKIYETRSRSVLLSMLLLKRAYTVARRLQVSFL